MIGRRVKDYCCGDITKIENYFEALNDTTQIWVCHHRREIDEGKTLSQLEEEGLYWNVKPEELIFLTMGDHMRLHNPCKGISPSLETRDKIRRSLTGRTQSKDTIAKRVMKLKGQKRTGEALARIQEGIRNRVFSEDGLKRLSERMKNSNNTKGTKWYNNGLKNMRAKECPEGFVHGRLNNYN